MEMAGPYDLSSPMLSPNTYLKERYRILHKIGGGGFGNVYKAIDDAFGCCVAIKETNEKIAREPKLQKGFEREAKILRSLKHECLPRVTDYFFNDQAQFLVMDFIEGDDLAVMLNRRLMHEGPFTVSEVLPWADRILSALEYLHSLPEPIIHRDIKPANIKLANDGVYLLDFGLAKGSTGQMSTVIDGQTGFSIAGGTPNYAPLEQLQQTGTGRQSDVYSFGATLYHLLTGKIIRASIREETIQKGLADPLKPAHEENAAIPIAISKVIEQAMIIRWWDRMASVREMRAALALASGDLVSTKPFGHALSPKIVRNERLSLPEPDKASATSNGRTSSTKRGSEDRRFRKSWLVAGFSALILVFITLGALLTFPQWFRPSVANTSDNLSISEKPTVLRTPTDLNPQRVGSHPGVWSIALSPDGNLAASASENNTIFLWDTKTWRKLVVLTGHNVVFSPDGNLLAAGGANKTIKLWDVHNAKQIEKEPPFPITKPVYQMAFSADSSTLAVFTAEPRNGDTDIQLWDLRNNNRESLKGEDGIALMAIAFSPASNVLFSAAGDNKLRSWNLTEKSSEILQTYPRALKAIGFSNDGKYLACASEDRTIKLWSYHSQTRKWLEQGSMGVPQGEITSLAFSPDGTTLVGTGTNNSIMFWDVASLKLVLTKQVDAKHRSPAFSSDPRMFLTVGDGSIWLWR